MPLFNGQQTKSITFNECVSAADQTSVNKTPTLLKETHANNSTILFVFHIVHKACHWTHLFVIVKY